MLQGISLKRRGREREKERESRHGGSQISKKPVQEAGLRNWSKKLVHPLFSRKAFYTFGCTEKSMDNTKLCSVSSPDSYRDQAFSLYTWLYTQVLGDLHHLLARRPINILRPFSDKGLSPRKLICLKSVVLSKVWCHSQKH